MRRNAKQNNSFLKSAAVFAAVLLSAFMLEAIQSTMSDSLKDDVTAMITNAKKLPHTIFIIDTSESMNTFAYSDGSFSGRKTVHCFRLKTASARNY